jgi:hypothetical protein
MAITAEFTKNKAKSYAVGMAGLIVIFSLYGTLIPVIENLTLLPPIISVPLVGIFFGIGAFFFLLEVFL